MRRMRRASDGGNKGVDTTSSDVTSTEPQPVRSLEPAGEDKIRVSVKNVREDSL